jgi:CheY-like chemotaxis protein
MYTREIILIEDNPSDVELTRRAFKKAKIVNPLRHFDHGEPALEYLNSFITNDKRINEMPLLILLDINLPLVSGLEILKAIKTSPTLRRILVVMLTTSSEHRDLESAYELGANSYIIKPVDFEKFSELIVQIGMYWMVINEPPKLRSEEE